MSGLFYHMPNRLAWSLKAFNARFKRCVTVPIKSSYRGKLLRYLSIVPISSPWSVVTLSAIQVLLAIRSKKCWASRRWKISIRSLTNGNSLLLFISTKNQLIRSHCVYWKGPLINYRKTHYEKIEFLFDEFLFEYKNIIRSRNTIIRSVHDWFWSNEQQSSRRKWRWHHHQSRYASCSWRKMGQIQGLTQDISQQWLRWLIIALLSITIKTKLCNIYGIWNRHSSSIKF